MNKGSFTEVEVTDLFETSLIIIVVAGTKILPKMEAKTKWLILHLSLKKSKARTLST